MSHQSPLGVVLERARTLPPAAFAYVMATGVISIGMHLVGAEVVSILLWIAAAGGWVGLSVLLVLRAVVAPARFGADLGDPSRAFGFFTVIAGTCVLGARVAVAGWDALATALWFAGLAMWLVAGYAIPWLVAVRAHHLGRVPDGGARRGEGSARSGDGVGTVREGVGTVREVAAGAREVDLARAVDGAWFVWVVAIQSVSVLASMLQIHAGAGKDLLAMIAVAAWATGLGLYAVVGTGLVVRVLRFGVRVENLGPSFWVVMGALAISTLASGRVLDMSQDSAAAATAHGAAAAVAVILWGFASWLLVGLLLLGFWRHVRRRVSARYTTELWAMVFPMGVYSVASLTVGTADRLPLAGDVGKVFIWVAVAAWLAVVLDGGITRLLGRRRAGS